MKIVFSLEVEDGFPPIASEALNATAADDGGFELENTPFFATGVALGDRVQAEPIPGTEGRYSFSEVLQSSSTRALSLIFLDTDIKEDVFQELKRHDCYCEYGEFGASKDLEMLAVAVPASCDYQAVSRYLTELEAKELLSFAELAV